MRLLEKYYFFDSNTAIGDRRLYSAADWSKVLSKFLENGIYVEGDNLTVTADGTSMAVTVGTGVAFIDGHMYENDAPLTLNVDAAEASLDRVDLVVLRLDITEQNRYIKVFVVKGEAAAAPVAPVPVDTTFIKEIPLAEIRVTAGKSIVDQTQITDRRPVDFVDPFADGSRITNLENVLVPQAEANAINWAKGFGLGGKSKDISNTDLNAITKTGFYSGYTLTNAPVNDNVGYLIHMEYRADNYSMQLFFSNEADGKTNHYTRQKYNGSWFAWQQLETTAGAQAKATSAETNAINFAKGFGLGELARGGKDWNTIDKTGFYAGSLNNPTGNNTSNYMGVHIQMSSNYAFQIAGRLNNFYMRNLENGIWNGWQRLTDDSYPTWSNLPLLNGAVIKQQPQYTRIGSLVLLRGLISCPAGTTFANLPLDLAPSDIMQFKTALNTNTAGADATITLYSDGRLYLNAATHANDIWLNGITFARGFHG